MSRLFYHTMQDNAGNLLFGVSGTMRLAGTGTLATIYGDEALTVILPNPMTNHPSFGSFKCFLGAGDYDFYMAKSGYTFETMTGLQGHGTMAQQDASAVSITGGTGLFTGQLQTTYAPASGVAFNVTPGRAYLHALGVGVTLPDNAVQGRLDVAGQVGIQALAQVNTALKVQHTKATQYGMSLQPTDNDTGTGHPVIFNNVAGTIVGTIATNASGTAYNTSSDVRLKSAITPLTGALDVVQALRPVAFRWNADDSVGHGFLAHELQQVVPEAVTGLPDEVNEDGSIKPQGVDHSRLVPWLTAALQEAVALTQALSARVGILEAHVSDLQAHLGL